MHNHFLDALCNACAAASYCGVRLLETKPPERKVITDWFARQARNSRPGVGFDRRRWNEMNPRYFDYGFGSHLIDDVYPGLPIQLR
jgi:hypothetical protein